VTTVPPKALRPEITDIDRTRVTVSSGPLAGTVLARVVGISASRADLPVDRLDEAMILADAIAAHAPAHVPEGRIELSCRTTAGCLELRLGPLRAGGGARLLDDGTLPSAGNVIRRFATETRVIERGEDEILVIRVDA